MLTVKEWVFIEKTLEEKGAGLEARQVLEKDVTTQYEIGQKLELIKEIMPKVQFEKEIVQNYVHGTLTHLASILEDYRKGLITETELALYTEYRLK